MASPTARCGSVSPDSFSAQEQARDPNSSLAMLPAAEPFYRTRISIDQVALHDVPAGFTVSPGMPVTADVKVGQRTVLKYLLGSYSHHPGGDARTIVGATRGADRR